MDCGESRFQLPWYPVCLLALVNAVNFMDRLALAVLAPSIRLELQMSDTQLGILLGFAFALFYAVCAIPIARWADRGVRRDIIAVAIAVWSVMTALSGAAQNFTHLLLARIGVGVGEAGCTAPGASLLCDYVPLQKRPTVIAIQIAGGSVGVLAGMALAGWLSEQIGWRWTFVALGLPGLLLALLIRMTLPEPVRGAFDPRTNRAAQMPLRETMAAIWRNKSYRMLASFLVAATFVQYGTINWLPSYFARNFNIDLATIGANLGLAVGLGAASGAVGGGVVASRMLRVSVRLPILMSIAATLLIVPVSVGILFATSFQSAIAFVFLAGLLWGIPNGPISALQYSVVSPDMRTTAASVTNFMISAVGLGIGTASVGLLSDMLGGSGAALRYALFAPLSLVPVMVVVLWAAMKVLPQNVST